MSKLFLILASFWGTPDYTGPVAAEAAYVIATQKAPVLVKECCGQCKAGVITHGDGHKTKCPCPDTCKCKAKGCEGGQCAPKK
jgi:hypothetical protein